MPFTRTQIIDRLRKSIKSDRPILAAGCSSGLIAKSAQAGGADVIVVYSTGKSRLMGLPTTRLGDANRVTPEMAPEILNVVSDTPIIGGMDATDPTCWDQTKTLARYRDAGFDGIINFPTISIFDDWRRRGEAVGLGFEREVELIKICNDQDIFTMSYVARPEDAEQMARAGVDCIVTHFGPTTGGMAGYAFQETPENLYARMKEIMEAGLAERSDVICLAHGGSIARPEDTAPLYRKGSPCVGFVGASSIERIPVEEAVSRAVIEFKNQKFGEAQSAVEPSLKLSAMHTGFTVASLDRSIAFYRDILGFPLLAERVIEGENTNTLTGISGARIRLAFLQMPGHLLELLEYLEPKGEQQATRSRDVGNGHVCFQVDDMMHAYNALKERGVEFQSDPVPIKGGPNDGGFAVYLKDPDGILLEIMQRPIGAKPIGGQ